METLVQLGGVYCLGFAIFHLAFWKLFHWKKDLAALAPINRAIMQVLNLTLIAFFLMTAYISLVHASALATRGLGTTVLAAVAIIWFLRAIEQVIFFGLKNPLSVFFFVLFLLGALLYALPCYVALVGIS